jgi:hypothetical protein
MSGLATGRRDPLPRGVGRRTLDGRVRWCPDPALLDAAGPLTPLAPTTNAWAMPRLDGVAHTYAVRGGSRTAAEIGIGLLRAGIAPASAWSLAPGDARAFVTAAIRNFVDQNGAPSIRKAFRLQLVLTGTLNEYSQSGVENAPNRLYLTIEPSEAGYFVMGPTVRALEQEHPRLPATFFSLLAAGVNRWVRTYDFRDASEHVERLREWYDSDPECEGAEVPDVEASVPKSMREQPLRLGELRRLLPSLTAIAQGWIERAMEIDRISRLRSRPRPSEEIEQKLSDCNPPLPSLLVVFSPGDNVEACFDAEAQSMMEVPPEPNLIIPVDGTNPMEIRRAFRVLKTACLTLAKTAELIATLPGSRP